MQNQLTRPMPSEILNTPNITPKVDPYAFRKSPEWRKKMSDVMKRAYEAKRNRLASPQKTSKSVAMQKNWQDPEYRARVLEGKRRATMEREKIRSASQEVGRKVYIARGIHPLELKRVEMKISTKRNFLKTTGVSYSTYRLAIRGKKISMGSKKKIEDFFGVSLDNKTSSASETNSKDWYIVPYRKENYHFYYLVVIGALTCLLLAAIFSII